VLNLRAVTFERLLRAQHLGGTYCLYFQLEVVCHSEALAVSELCRVTIQKAILFFKMFLEHYFVKIIISLHMSRFNIGTRVTTDEELFGCYSQLLEFSIITVPNM
jgi:hypothetical protein